MNRVALVSTRAPKCLEPPVLVPVENLLRLARQGAPLRYYRHPFLHAGPTLELKQGLQANRVA